MADAVDAIIEAWRRERPEIDTWPVGIVGRVQRLSRLLERGVQEFFSRHGLDNSEADVLTTLRRSGPPYELTAGALLKAAMVTSGAITKRLDRMEAKNLVVRVPDPTDRRSVRVRLTPHGKQVVDTLFADHIANEARLLRALDRTTATHLADTLRLLLESLGDTAPDRAGGGATTSRSASRRSGRRDR